MKMSITSHAQKILLCPISPKASLPAISIILHAMTINYNKSEAQLVFLTIHMPEPHLKRANMPSVQGGRAHTHAYYAQLKYSKVDSKLSLLMNY
jgi:hypothetical protein